MPPDSTHFTRTVHQADAIAWLQQTPVLTGCSLVASMPDISEFPSYSPAQWKEWFVQTAQLILSRTPDDGVCVFYQSDIKLDGEWIDKGFLCQKAAESSGHALLWHKIACRVEPGRVTFGRPGYSHILCFSKQVKAEISKSTSDVLPDLGEKIWERGMGITACALIAKFIAEQTATRTIVNPFCGQGSMLAVANALGLSAIGIERSAKRAALAEQLNVSADLKSWKRPPS
ncbi:MAG: SAM-dependent methyltransferase [Deltaproteobacteria bacterium]|nr:SAM-dependent methyltransferase [Deltaproteobacteria bacterium]